MTKGSEDYNKGKHLPSPVTPVTNVCFKIVIPDAVEYRAALFGVLGQLSQWYTWEHPTDGTTCFDCEEAAQLWAKAISEAYFDEDCEGVMACDDVADCIETSPAVQAALATQIASNTLMQGATYDAARHGVPLSPTEANANLTAEANCVLDNLFGSVTALVDQLNTNNVDFLEQFEIESNTIERASALFAAVPIMETLPIDDALSFIDTVMGEFKEFYDAAWTTALKDTYRCDLFCMAKGNPGCAVTFEMLVTYFENRLGASLSNEALLLNMVEFLVAGSWSGTQIVDAMMLAQVVIWREASNFLGVSFRTLQTVGLLGANDSDSDWTILCDECNITCVGTWPDPMTFYQGTITNRTGDVYSVTPVTDPVPNYKAIRTSNYGNWTKGSFLLNKIEVIGGPAFQLYIEGPTGTVLYNGTSPAAANLVLPACARYFQAIDHTTTPDFTVKLTIVT